MKTLGLDIGTTTISCAVYDSGAGVMDAMTVKNQTFLSGAPWERIQDPHQIRELCRDCVKTMLSRFPQIQAIGVTGQMHGILYLDRFGEPVSPLYTWQDGRGELPYGDNMTWAAHLSRVTGHPLSTGYGLVTHFYNLNSHLIPKSAAVFCTIGDYIAMDLAGAAAPKTDATNAASLGLYDPLRGCFSQAALEKAGIAPGLLPELATDPCLGTGPLGIPVYAAIGDNQASFLGATEDRRDALLINMGTGGQISLFVPEYIQAPSLETRPFPGGGWLLVGSSLCGGRSYAILEAFFCQTVKALTGQEISGYDAMARMLAQGPVPQDLPKTATTFQGTRSDPDCRASITGLTPDNFTPRHLTWSLMEGMARELYQMYEGYLLQGAAPFSHMIGSGNGLRKNPWLCQVFEEVFQCSMTLSQNQEEAACGAARYAMELHAGGRTCKRSY